VARRLRARRLRLRGSTNWRARRASRGVRSQGESKAIRRSSLPRVTRTLIRSASGVLTARDRGRCLTITTLPLVFFTGVLHRVNRHAKCSPWTVKVSSRTRVSPCMFCEGRATPHAG
jgi:hypothetical protein